MALKRFQDRERVIVVSAESPHMGKSGVVRTRVPGDAAWVHLDDAPDGELALLYADECAREPLASRHT